jgi:hypothetical protein
MVGGLIRELATFIIYRGTFFIAESAETPPTWEHIPSSFSQQQNPANLTADIRGSRSLK